MPDSTTPATDKDNERRYRQVGLCPACGHHGMDCTCRSELGDTTPPAKAEPTAMSEAEIYQRRISTAAVYFPDSDNARWIATLDAEKNKAAEAEQARWQNAIAAALEAERRKGEELQREISTLKDIIERNQETMAWDDKEIARVTGERDELRERLAKYEGAESPDISKYRKLGESLSTKHSTPENLEGVLGVMILALCDAHTAQAAKLAEADSIIDQISDSHITDVSDLDFSKLDPALSKIGEYRSAYRSLQTGDENNEGRNP
jgi:hypothetical protein